MGCSQTSWFLAVAVLALCMSVLVRTPSFAPRHLLSSWGPTGTRAFGGSSTSQKAIPFSLHNRGTTVEKDNGASDGKVLRMLMFGKPGAGKGTLSARLVKKFDIVSLSTGDLLRQHIAEKCVC